MKESKLFSLLLPSHPDLLPIIQEIRRKYNFPEVGPDDDGITEILLADKTIDWLAVRQDIETQVRHSPELLPSWVNNLLLSFSQPGGLQINIKEFEEFPDETKNQLNVSFAKLIIQLIGPFVTKMDEFYKVVSDSLFAFLLTGEPREIPNNWLGGAYTFEISGEKMVVAVAGQPSDPKAVSDEFRQEYARAFGKDRPKITESNINTAEYLRMKMAGMAVKDIVDVYIQRHPSEFPKKVNSNEYRVAKRKHLLMMTKRLQRLQDTINTILEDKK